MTRGPFLFIALLATAAAPVLAAEHAASAPVPIQTADTGDFASQKAEYKARAQQEMDRWRQRMSEAGGQAQDELVRAWSATKDQWADLQQATAESWDSSRAAFERASERMKEDWRKYHPDDK